MRIINALLPASCCADKEWEDAGAAWGGSAAKSSPAKKGGDTPPRARPPPAGRGGMQRASSGGSLKPQVSLPASLSSRKMIDQVSVQLYCGGRCPIVHKLWPSAHVLSIGLPVCFLCIAQAPETWPRACQAGRCGAFLCQCVLT